MLNPCERKEANFHLCIMSSLVSVLIKVLLMSSADNQLYGKQDLNLQD